MINLRRAEERHHDRSSEQESWLTFFPHDRAFVGGFSTLETLDEGRLSPCGGLRRPDHDAETVTYVREGAVAWQDSMENSGVVQEGVVQAGEFRRMTRGRGSRHRETNASHKESAHVFQVGLRSAPANPRPSPEQKRFGAAERRGRLCIVGSSDGREGSLRLHHDASMYSALLAPGKHVVHEILPGRSAWLHLVQGEATLGDFVLATGDGAGVSAERTVSLTAQEETEILLFDLRESLPRLMSESSFRRQDHEEPRQAHYLPRGRQRHFRVVPSTVDKQCTKEITKMNIRPLHDRVLAQRIEIGEQVSGGIIIPDSAKEQPQEAEVTAVGPGKVNDDGSRSVMDVAVGDRILIGKYAGSEIKVDDKDLVILREDEIFAIVEH